MIDKENGQEQEMNEQQKVKAQEEQKDDNLGDGSSIEPNKAAEEHEEIKTEENQKNNELNDRLLRLQADFDNFRRRTRQEKDEFFKYANQDLLTSLLPVIDNFERALAANDKTDDPYAAGVNMIYKQLMEVLTKEGLAQIEAVGTEFDPNLHEAVMSVKSDEHGPNIVIEEFQKGYKFKERVIRPSMVKVANSK